MEFRRTSTCGSCSKRSWEWTPQRTTQLAPQRTYTGGWTQSGSQRIAPTTSYTNSSASNGMPPTTTYH